MASKTARRDAGGGAFQDSRGLWTAARSSPDDNRRCENLGACTKAAASDKLGKLRAALDRTGGLPNSSPILEQWMRIWLKTKPRDMSRKASTPAPVPSSGRGYAVSVSTGRRPPP